MKRAKTSALGHGLVALHIATEKPNPSPARVIRVVQEGLHFAELESLRAQLDLPLDRLAEKLGLARATLHRRKASGRLTSDESDKVLRFARLLGQAVQLFGGIDDARRWMKAPQRGLGGAVPLDYAQTETGAREVENLLGRIDYGVYS
ncbi:MAG TPA: antitoxin Xre/MbcA/ParS toxin-binding domain-containing protein [Chthoniobacterales bacterium]|jgi:putative toxin-antitoxin system antitoxin component (TIGR02293 family)|nr:antitoxin Xre/MbcA/ParS toxin-binding domain-containing protein [Chthoniobacterales bacterium]